jgi:hypothetical protein
MVKSGCIIVGCGNIGSILAFNLLFMKNIKHLIIIDHDILNRSNLPYLFLTNDDDNINNFLNCPKVFALLHQLNKFNNDITISFDDESFDGDFNKHLLFDEKDYLKIDCRDTLYNQELFDIKLNLDFDFGRIIINPNDIKDRNDKFNYIKKPDLGTTMLFISDVIKLLKYNMMNNIHIDFLEPKEIFLNYNTNYKNTTIIDKKYKDIISTW